MDAVYSSVCDSVGSTQALIADRRIVEEGKISSNVEYKNEYIADRFAIENGY